MEFHQEVLPLVALTLWFAAQIEEQWQKVFCKQAPIGTIVASEQCRFQGAPRHVGAKQRFPIEPGTNHLCPQSPPPILPRCYRVELPACCAGHRTARRAGTATKGGTGNLKIRCAMAYAAPHGRCEGQTSADRRRTSRDNRSASSSTSWAARLGKSSRNGAPYQCGGVAFRRV